MSYELFVLFQFLSHVMPMSYELSCEILVPPHVSPTSYGLSHDILVLIACVAHALSMKGSLTLAMGKCLWFSVKKKFVKRPFLCLEATLT